jgi:hypothetical protein
MTKHSEDELNENIRQSLDESVDALDANTLSKIRQVRAQAVNRAEGHHINKWSGFLIGSLATACVMVLAVVLLLNSPNPMQSVPVDDIDLISSSDNLDLFEDLEFYEWLEEDGLPS